jgi:hypothetical protein
MPGVPGIKNLMAPATAEPGKSSCFVIELKCITTSAPVVSYGKFLLQFAV